MFSEHRYVYVKHSVVFGFVHVFYIFYPKNIVAFYKNMCIRPELKSETLLDIWVYNFVYTCYYVSWVLNSNRSDNLLYLMSFIFKFAKPKMTIKTTSFLLYFCTNKGIISGFCTILSWEIYDWRFSLKIFDLQIQNGKRQHKIIAFFMHLTYNIMKQYIFDGYTVIRQISLQGILG